MARKRSKKRRVRRKSRARKSRSRKSSRRSRSRRRRNPGNFVKPTPTVAQAHLDTWEKRGVTDKQQIKIGMKAPYVGVLKDDKDVKLAKIRYKEAQNTVNWYLDHFTRGGAKWQGNVHEAYKMAVKEWKEAKAKGTKLPAPIAPSKTASATRGGNFKKVSKAHATRYLKSLFRWPNKTVDGKLDAGKMDSYAGLGTVSRWITAKGGDVGARLAEAVTIVGAGEAAKLFRQAQKNAADYAAKKAAAKAKRDAANKARWQKQLKRINDERKKLQKKIKESGAVAARAKARAKKSRKRRSRRRNPVRRRNSCGTREKGTMRRRRKKARKSRKAKRARKSRKARKSRRKSRRSRRRR